MKLKSSFIILLLIPTFYLTSLSISKTNLPGFGIDPFFCATIIKHIVSQISQGNHFFSEIFWNVPMFFPNKYVLAFSDPFILQGYFVYFLNKIIGIDFVLSIGILYLSCLLLAWGLMSVLLSLLFNNSLIAIIAGWLFAFSNHTLSQSAHLQNTMNWLIILCLVGIVLLLKSRKILLGMFCICLSISGLCLSNLYYLYFTLIVLSSSSIFFVNQFDLILTFKKLPIFKRILTYIFCIFSLSILIFTYLQYSYVIELYSGLKTQRSLSDLQSFSSKAIDLFSGTLNSPIYSNLLPTSTNLEKNISPGFFTFIFSIISSVFIIFNIRKITFAQKLGIFLCFIGIFFATIGAFSEQLLQWICNYLPGFKQMRAIGRIGILAVIGHLILMTSLMLRIYKPKNLKSILLVTFLLSFQVIERIVPQYRQWHSSVELSSKEAYIIEEINKINAESVLFVGSTKDEDLIKLFYSINKPIVNGYSGFTLPVPNPKEEIYECKFWSTQFAKSLNKNRILVLENNKIDLNCLSTNSFIVTKKNDAYIVILPNT